MPNKFSRPTLLTGPRSHSHPIHVQTDSMPPLSEARSMRQSKKQQRHMLFLVINKNAQDMISLATLVLEWGISLGRVDLVVAVST